ncbi:MAG: hypothetical protein WBB67_09660 [bacterium]
MAKENSNNFNEISDFAKHLATILPIMLGDLFVDNVEFDDASTTELALLLNEFLFESTRARPIFVADMLNKKLANVLKKYLIDTGSKLENDNLLGDHRPLQSFASRIDIAYRIGLIDTDLRDHLKRVNKIRVIFAHNWMAWDFDAEATKYVQDLRFFNFAKKNEKDFQDMYNRLFAKGCSITMSELTFLLCTTYLYISLIALEQVAKPIQKTDIYKSSKGR